MYRWLQSQKHIYEPQKSIFYIGECADISQILFSHSTHFCSTHKKYQMETYKYCICICIFCLILFAVPVNLYGYICVFIWLYLECLWICICIFIWLYLQCLHSCIVFIWLYLQCFYYSICIFIRLYATIVFAVFLFGCICRYHSSAPVRYSVHQRFRSRFLWPNNNNTNNNKNKKTTKTNNKISKLYSHESWLSLQKSEKCRGDYLHQLFKSKHTQKKRKL